MIMNLVCAVRCHPFPAAHPLLCVWACVCVCCKFVWVGVRGVGGG